MKTTYSEVQKMDPFDWRIFLNDAMEKMPNEKIRCAAVRRSMSWVTCACGNQCALLPRDKDGEPDDRELMWHGVDFLMAVEGGRWMEALEILEKIERRSSYLLLEMAKKQVEHA